MKEVEVPAGATLDMPDGLYCNYRLLEWIMQNFEDFHCDIWADETTPDDTAWELKANKVIKVFHIRWSEDGHCKIEVTTKPAG